MPPDHELLNTANQIKMKKLHTLIESVMKWLNQVLTSLWRVL
jgi:hypothetical protein